MGGLQSRCTSQLIKMRNSKLLHNWISLFSVSVLWGYHETPIMSWMCKCGLAWGGRCSTVRREIRPVYWLLLHDPSPLFVPPASVSFLSGWTLPFWPEGYLGFTVWGVSPNSALCVSCPKPVLPFYKGFIFICCIEPGSRLPSWEEPVVTCNVLLVVWPVGWLPFAWLEKEASVDHRLPSASLFIYRSYTLPCTL